MKGEEATHCRGVIPGIYRHEHAGGRWQKARHTGRDIALTTRGQAQGAYTAKQGQYLAFIYYYTKIHGRSPSEADLRGYFRVSPPSVHQMVLSLERLEFIERTPGQGRSLKLLLPRDQLPDLM